MKSKKIMNAIKARDSEAANETSTEHIRRAAAVASEPCPRSLEKNLSSEKGKERKMPSELFEKGLQVRREVLGAEYVDASLAQADDFSRPLQELVTEYCWGAVWTRPGLTRKTRSLLNLAMLTALNRPHEVKIHLKGALTNGCSKKEIMETLLQAAIYCGVPAAVDSFRLAREVFKEVDSKSE